MAELQALDTNMLYFIQSFFKNPAFDALMPLITAFADHGQGFILLSLILICFKKTRSLGITLAIGLFLSLLVGNLTIKPLVGRIRPFLAEDFLGLLIAPPHDPSFPSGHTLCSFISAVIIFHYHKKLGIFAIVFAALIGFSRLYLFVHYPSDVLSGAALGVFLGCAAVIIMKRWISPFLKKKNILNKID